MRNGVGITAGRSDGLTFNYESTDWGLLDIKGIDFPEVEIFTEPQGLGNGDIITGKRKHSREIQLTAHLRRSENSAADRARVIGFHNSNYTYALKLTYMGVSRVAKNCELKAISYPSENVYTNPKLTLMFLSPDADLYADNTDSVSFVTTQSLWHDTRAYTPESSLVFGQMVQATEKVINYIGSEPAPIVVTIRATGYVNGCRVSVGDFEAVIATELHSADVLIIDAEERLVSKNGTPVPEADYDAAALTELKLGYGDNIVTVGSDSTAFSAEVDYVGRYGGI